MKSLTEFCLKSILNNNIQVSLSLIDIRDQLKYHEFDVIRKLKVASSEIKKLHNHGKEICDWSFEKPPNLCDVYSYKRLAAESYVDMNTIIPDGRLMYFSFIDPYAEYYLHDDPIPENILNSNPLDVYVHELNPEGGTDLNLDEYKTLFAYIKADTGNISDMSKRKKLRGYFMHRADTYPIEIIDPYNKLKGKISYHLLQCLKFKSMKSLSEFSIKTIYDNNIQVNLACTDIQDQLKAYELKNLSEQKLVSKAVKFWHNHGYDQLIGWWGFGLMGAIETKSYTQGTIEITLNKYTRYWRGKLLTEYYLSDIFNEKLFNQANLNLDKFSIIDKIKR